MKKKYLIIIALFISAISYSQNWKVGSYTDSFGDKSGRKFIYRTEYGKFSNSATQNSRLMVVFYSSKNKTEPNISIKLYEYNKSLVTNNGGYNLSIKDDKGNVHEFHLINYNGEIISSYSDIELHNLIKRNKTLKFYIEEHTSSYSSYPSTYSFTLNCSGYTKMHTTHIGYVDKYYKTGDFFEGLTKVRLNNKYGFIDKSEKVVIPIKYNDISDFKEGWAKVKLHNKYGFINKSGKVVIPLKYGYISDFEEGLAKVYLDGKYIYIDKSGKVIKYDNIHNFKEGLAKVELNGKYGLIDKSEKIVIPIKYDNMHISDFKEGLAEVKLDGKYLYIDKSGKVVTNYITYSSFKEEDGLVQVRLNGKYGFIDKSGKVVIPIKYNYISSDYFNGGVVNVILNGQYGKIYMNKGIISSTSMYDDISDFNGGLDKVRLNDKYGLINKTGKVVIPIKYDDIYNFNEGLAKVELNGKWGFVDKNGKVIIPIKYDDAWYFNEGFAKVELNDKWGFIDKTGKVVIPLKKYGSYFSFDPRLHEKLDKKIERYKRKND